MAKRKKRKKTAKRKTARKSTRRTTKRKTPRKRKMSAARADVKIYKKSGRPVIIVAKGVTAKGKKVINKCAAMRRARGGKVPRFQGGICCKPSHAATCRKVAKKMGARVKTIAVKG